MIVDLRSDTVTRPTEAMRAAMAAAPVGDDVYGDDPTVNRLEATVAALLGHEAGLFTPTGSLANMLGVRLHVGPGQELVTDAQAHVVRAELGGHAALAGVTTRTYDAPRGLVDPEVVRRFIRPDAGPYLVSTTCVAIENTHNFGGGTVQPLEALQGVREVADDAGIAVHLDGARLWHAQVASGVPLAAYGAIADTVSVCFSKGLGAPVGSVLVGRADRIAEARVWRKRYGAGMRQVGILAAGCLHALDHHVARLAEDHARALRLAFALAETDDRVLDPAHVDTNIVALDVSPAGWRAPEFAAAARDEGVLVGALGPTFVRAVTHLDVDDDGIERASTALARLLREGPA